MLDAALKFLTDLAKKTATPVSVDLKDPSRLGFVVDGNIITEDVPNPARKHKAKSLDEVIRIATRFVNPDQSVVPAPVVWYDETEVVLSIDDDAYRIDSVTLTLETSDVFAKLVQLSKPTQPVDQKEFIRLLRVDLAGTLEPVVLLNKVRTLKFSTTADATSVKKAQTESLGKEIRSKVETDGGDLPEEVVLSAPVFKTFGQRRPVPIRCAVEVFPADGTFRLKPLPDEIERAQQEAVQRIAERLSEELPDMVPAYYGKP